MLWASSRGSSLLLGHKKATRFLCWASSCPSPSSFSSFPCESHHVSFIKDMGATQPPQFANLAGHAQCKSQFIHRILVEEDATNSQNSSSKLFKVAAGAGKKIYEKGDFAKSEIPSVDDYLLRKVGLFPDVLERKVMHHLEEGDHVPALVTVEFYARKTFPQICQTFSFQRTGLDVKEKPECCQGSSEITMVDTRMQVRELVPFPEVAHIAEWEDEQIEHITEKMTEEGRVEDLNKGKPRAQIAFDEAAFLFDLASVEGTWDDHVEQIADCYKDAVLDDIARVVLYTD